MKEFDDLPGICYYKKNSETPQLYKVIRMVSKGPGYTVHYINASNPELILKLANSIFDKHFIKLDDEKFQVHYAHCCNHHGCKYGDVDCPVETQKIPGKYRCETCDMMRDDAIAQFPFLGFKLLDAKICKEVYNGEKVWVFERAMDFKIKYSEINGDLSEILLKSIDHVKEELNDEISEILYGGDR